MPGGSLPCLGNQQFQQILYSAAVTFPTLAANASSSTSVTLNGVLPGDFIICNLQAPAAHLFVENIYVSAANTLAIVWGTDGTGVTGSTVGALFKVTRFQNQSLGLSFYPTALI